MLLVVIILGGLLAIYFLIHKKNVAVASATNTASTIGFWQSLFNGSMFTPSDSGSGYVSTDSTDFGDGATGDGSSGTDAGGDGSDTSDDTTG